MTELGTSRRRFLRAAAVGIPAAGALAVGSTLTAPAANAAQTSSTPSNQNQNPEAQGAATNAQYLSEKAKNFHILLDMYKQAGDAVDATQLTQEAQRIRGAADESNSPFPSRPVSWAGVQLERDRMQLAAKINYAAMRAEIASVVALQERLGLDVLVHGEAERNDMVQYFAELLDGFVTTEHGWVQSYGSRCTRPSILWGDVARPEPMTVTWSAYAQSLTDKPLKGMLTGPVTILAWSFVRDDQPRRETANQVALALADEIADLEQAGIRIIQVDEPALRELLPLRRDEQPQYLDWSVNSFRLATSAVKDSTQIHTHLCYSEFNEIIDSINALNADVTSIEAARSHMELLADIPESYVSGLGPGVWDIHSPRVPSQSEVEELIRAAIGYGTISDLWVNPDCGLKTRDYEETKRTLKNVVAATKKVRASL